MTDAPPPTDDSKSREPSPPPSASPAPRRRRKSKPAKTRRFEEALAELEEIVHRLESGESGLDQALQDYESGVALLKHCYQALEAAQTRIELLAGVDEDGTPRTEPFAVGEDQSLAEKQQSRSRRRSHPQPPTDEGDVDEEQGLF